MSSVWARPLLLLRQTAADQAAAAAIPAGCLHCGLNAGAAEDPARGPALALLLMLQQRRACTTELRSSLKTPGTLVRRADARGCWLQLLQRLLKPVL